MAGRRSHALAAAAAVALGAGCGDDERDTTSRGDGGGAGSSLELILDADGDGGSEPRSEAVDCADPSTAKPTPLCAAVFQLGPEDFDPTPADVACTEIYGGPDTLEVSGTLDGEAAEGTFTRENGCEIDRFDAWLPVLEEAFPGYRPGESLAP